MGRQHANDSTDDLDDRVADRFQRLSLFAQSENSCHRWIEMRTGNRPQHGDEHNQDSTGWKRVAKQCKSNVTPRQPLAHDAGADHRRQQQSRAEELGCKALGKCR